MPFLRRRGVTASDNDMRRHNHPPLDAVTATAQPPQSSPQPAAGVADPAAAEASSSADVANHAAAPTVVVEPPPSPAVVATAAGPAEMGGESGSAVSLERPETPPIQPETQKHRRFSMLRFRNASDSQLSARAKQHAEAPPPLPPRRSRRARHGRVG